MRKAMGVKRDRRLGEVKKVLILVLGSCERERWTDTWLTGKRCLNWGGGGGWGFNTPTKKKLNFNFYALNIFRILDHQNIPCYIERVHMDVKTTEDCTERTVGNAESLCGK
jgi:hypothetical protein